MIRIFVTRRVSTFLVVLSCLISAQPAPAQSEKVKAAMQPFVDGGEVAGIVTFIGGKNGLLDVQTLGMADIENKRPMERDTIFRIASMTKPVTALAVMQLVEQGKVNIEDQSKNICPSSRGNC